MVVCIGQELLLVRSSYRAEWTLPGGGIRRGESPYRAAQRELAEEIGLQTTGMRPFGVASGLWDGRRDRIHFFELRLDWLPELQFDDHEREHAKWWGVTVVG